MSRLEVPDASEDATPRLFRSALPTRKPLLTSALVIVVGGALVLVGILGPANRREVAVPAGVATTDTPTVDTPTVAAVDSATIVAADHTLERRALDEARHHLSRPTDQSSKASSYLEARAIAEARGGIRASTRPSLTAADVLESRQLREARGR